ncbi:cytochrome c [Deinococcus sp. KSM4-11]|uniref:c-type cytochrome n=1 Tax=Deinococcus sp. KSM4-11 TaxID=2568654 RepID=UPI0010A47763|nr:c-type cytochrome [Deinococcus sp. KSM4-11]THF83626.1 cytochrome c [Deinococcus sp. KSM4-11]
MNRMPQRNAGDVLSWALGVTVGGILGAALLIATPIMMRQAAKTGTAATTETATATPAAAAPTPAPEQASTSAATPADSSAMAAGDAKAGATVFASNCAGCHGAAAKGGVGANLTTADGPKAWTDAQMITALREGKTPQKTLNTIMPRFTAAQVSDTDIANIHAWIKSLN